MTDAQTLINAAREVQPGIQSAGLAARLDALHLLEMRIRDDRDRIIDALVADTGKCRTDALVSEIMGVLDYLHWLRKSAPKILADEKVSTPLALMGKQSRIWHQPVGVVLVITPWNYPFHIGLTSAAAAFAAGNAVVVKSSEVTPLNGLYESLVRGLPLLSDGFQVAYGDGAMGAALVNAGPDKICFTGSTRTGKKILAAASERLIPVELELGGKDAMIVFDDVNIERTSAGALWGAITNAGQSCTSVERLYVQRGIYDRFVQRLGEQMSELVVNHGDRGDADLGRITVGFQREIILEHLRDAREQGATVIGGDALGDDQSIAPALVTGVTQEMKIWRDETFGPVIPVMAFDSEEEVIRLANDSPFGLSASVWSKDLARAQRVARQVRVGAVSINNVMLTEGNPALPFGGTGQSGYGRVKGAEGLLAMTRSKAVLIDKQSKKIEANWYPYTREKYGLFEGLIEGLFGQGMKALLRFVISGIKLESAAQKPRVRDKG